MSDLMTSMGSGLQKKNMVTGKYAVKAKVVSLTGGKHSLNAANVRKDRNHLDRCHACVAGNLDAMC